VKRGNGDDSCFRIHQSQRGVCKSTFATNTAFGIAGMPRRAGAPNARVLLIDTDSQAHATLLMTGSKDYGWEPAIVGDRNNFTRMISAKDPLTIVLIKRLGARTFSLLLALILGNPLPAFPVVLGALLLGSISYGMSIVLFIRGMRGLGATRTSL
jgi:hypothetical protein